MIYWAMLKKPQIRHHRHSNLIQISISSCVCIYFLPFGLFSICTSYRYNVHNTFASTLHSVCIIWRWISFTVETIWILSSPPNFSNTFDTIYKLLFMAGSDEMVASTVFNRVKYAWIHTWHTHFKSTCKCCVCVCLWACFYGIHR